MTKKVGIIGVGLLGGALASRLAKQGWEVIGHDPSATDTEALTMCDRATELVAQCETVLLSLPTSDVVVSVIDSVESAITNQHCFVDTTTGEPEEMEAIGKNLNVRGANYLEANVAGSSELAKTGKTTLFLGGEKELIHCCQDLLNALAPKQFHVGPVGAASRFNLIHNLILGLNRAGLAEGLALAEALGFNASEVLAILRETPATSVAMEAKGNKMAKGIYAPPQAKLAQHLKDVRIIRHLADKAGANTPLTNAHQSLLEEAESLGFGESDNAAIIEAFRHNL
tara:strand:+ start:6074 stop:6925 length:852 start_codon:yes stop_codon:yes gene_type:complete